MSTLTHRRTIVPALAAAAVFAAVITAGGAPATAQARTIRPNVSGQPWRNPDQPPEARASELLAALSTDQKIQLALGNFAALASFGVPALKADDGPDGLRNPGTTALPSGQALAASFDRSLASAYGQVVGSEARGEGFNEWLGPAVDIDRTPLAGRQPEAEGEDPYLAGQTAAQVIGGAQSQHVISTLKHYTAYNQDWGRIGFSTPDPAVRSPGVNVAVSERALQEIYEAPFRTAVQQGHADSVMCSYNQINGLPSCQNPATLGDLKHGDGLKGFVVPDFGFAARDPVAAALAGVDLPTLPGNAPGLTAADFTAGKIPAARLDDIDRRILYAIFASGAFDHPLPAKPATEVSTPQHQRVAADVAEAGTVLLKNDHQVLPLAKSVRSVAVIGPSGDDAVFVTGGSAGVPLAAGQAVTPLAGITARAAAAGVTGHLGPGLGGRRGLAHPGPVLGARAQHRVRTRAARHVLEQRRLQRDSGADQGRPGRGPLEGSGRDRRPVVGQVDRDAHPGRDRPVPVLAVRVGDRDPQDRRPDIRPGLPRGDAVRRRAALRPAGHGPADRGQAGAGRDRLLEPQCPVQPGDPLRLADPVEVGHPGRGASRPRRRTSRSCSPTTRRARAWTARRCPCRVTRIS